VLWKTDFRAADLRQTEFKFYRLNDVSFEGANLYGANFFSDDSISVHPQIPHISNCSFRSATMDEVVFDGVRINDVDFGHAELSGASFIASSIYRTIFFEAELYKSDFATSRIQNSTFSGADLRASNLTGAEFTNTGFLQARLFATNLSGTVFYETDLRHADLGFVLAKDADFSAASGLTQEQFSSAIGNANTKFPQEMGDIHAWSCWQIGHGFSSNIIERVSELRALDDSNFAYKPVGNPPRAMELRYACPPGTEPQPVGTYVPAE